MKFPKVEIKWILKYPRKIALSVYIVFVQCPPGWGQDDARSLQSPHNLFWGDLINHQSHMSNKMSDPSLRITRPIKICHHVVYHVFIWEVPDQSRHVTLWCFKYISEKYLTNQNKLTCVVSGNSLRSTWSIKTCHHEVYQVLVWELPDQSRHVSMWCIRYSSEKYLPN